MPLVAPILRLCMLFLNVYETYKTLKTPPQSARHNGRPSVRAATQRKRNMKGCLAVWIVWCCFAAYDRTLDGIVKLFVPFYDELKSLVILFFILTRARGAEPIYLHIIRPLVKPYTSLLDSLLDLICMLGDFVFILLALPVRLALSWWHSLFSHEEHTRRSHGACSDISDPTTSPEHEVNDSLPRTSSTSKSVSHHRPQRQQDVRRPSNRISTARRHVSDTRQLPNNSSRGFDRTHRSASETAVNGRIVSNHSTSARDSTRTSKSTTTKHFQRPQNKPISKSAVTTHQIWYPPPYSLDGPSEDDEPMPAETATSSTSSGEPSIPKVPIEGLPETDTMQLHVDEWRLYPPCPAAYPPTPLPVVSTLPPPNRSSIVQQRAFNPAQFLPIPEDVSAGPQLSIGRLSLPPREPLKRGFNTSSSDGDSMFGGQNDQQVKILTVDYADDEDEGGEDGEGEGEGEEEDDFDMTLRTPLPPIGNSRTRSGTSNVSTAGSSVRTRSTALTTADNGSSMRTRTTSESSGSISISDSMSISDSSSMARRKRSIPPPNNPDVTNNAGGVVREASRTTVFHQEVFGWMAGKGGGANNLEDDYDSTSTDSDSDDSSFNGDRDQVGNHKRRTSAASKQLSADHTTPTRPAPARPKVSERIGSTTSNVPPTKPSSIRSVQVPPRMGSRKSSRIANLGTAPPITRRVTAPASRLSSQAGVPAASVVHRHASDRNPARRKDEVVL